MTWRITVRTTGARIDRVDDFFRSYVNPAGPVEVYTCE
jgi:hypothetical protein